jgi:hypothetical protein
LSQLSPPPPPPPPPPSSSQYLPAASSLTRVGAVTLHVKRTVPALVSDVVGSGVRSDRTIRQRLWAQLGAMEQAVQVQCIQSLHTLRRLGSRLIGTSLLIMFCSVLFCSFLL